MKKYCKVLFLTAVVFSFLATGIAAANLSTEDTEKAFLENAKSVNVTADSFDTVAKSSTVNADNDIAALSAFTDINGHWAYHFITYATDKKLFAGTSATTFSPDMAMTRDMFVSVLGRYAGVPDVDPKEASFSDVPVDNYAAPYVAWAAENGISVGIGDGKFGYGEPVKRQDIARLLNLYFQKETLEFQRVSNPYRFRDQKNIADYALDAVVFMQEIGVLSGSPDNYFNPTGNATRAEVASIFTRFMKSLDGEKIVLEYPHFSGIPTYSSVTLRPVLSTSFWNEDKEAFDDPVEGFDPEGDLYFSYYDAAEKTAYCTYLTSLGFQLVETDAADGVVSEDYAKGDIGVVLFISENNTIGLFPY